MSSRLRHALPFDAGAFAFVMATGIVSVDCFEQRLPYLSGALLAIAALAALALAGVMGARALERPRRRPRLESFAIVAAGAVLGARFALANRSTVAIALWAIATAVWFVLLASRPLATRPGGGWFLAVVGTESLAVLASLIAPVVGHDVLFAALVWWLAGIAFYPMVAAAIAVADSREPRFDPSLWIAMGALAIATLAGAGLLGAARSSQTFPGLDSFLRGADLATWAVASALIVPLAVVDLRARRWRYHASRWSFVFPLGMYSVATGALGHAAGLGALAPLARAFFVIALVAWTLTFAGFVRAALTSGVFPRRRTVRS